MSGHYGRPRTGRTRDPIELRLAGAATVVSVLLANATFLSWPGTGWWASPFYVGFMTNFLFGLMLPPHLPYLLISTAVMMGLTVFVWRWAIRSMRVRTPSEEEAEQQDLRLNVAVGLSLVPVCVAVIAYVLSPWNPMWDANSSGTLSIIDILGMTPTSHPFLFAVTSVLVVLAAVAWWWTFRSVRGPSAFEKNVLERRHEPAQARSTLFPLPRPAEAHHRHGHIPASSNGVVCPKCGSALVKTTNRRTGETFLGCPRFPKYVCSRPMPKESSNSSVHVHGGRS